MTEPPALAHFPGYTTSYCPIAGKCTRCRTMHHVFVNRNGRTHCLECDQELHPKETHHG